MKVPWVVLLFAVAAFAHAADSDIAAKGEALIQQAQDKINIFALPSFRMDANVRIDNFGKPLDGTYSLLWNGPDQWREEIMFPGYSEVQVGNKGVVYSKRNTPSLPYQIFQLREALGFGTTAMGTGFFNLGANGGEAVKRLHEKKINGAKATCIEITSEMKYTREVCIDQTTGTIRRDNKAWWKTSWIQIYSRLALNCFPILWQYLMRESGSPRYTSLNWRTPRLLIPPPSDLRAEHWPATAA